MVLTFWLDPNCTTPRGSTGITAIVCKVDSHYHYIWLMVYGPQSPVAYHESLLYLDQSKIICERKNKSTFIIPEEN